MTTSKHSLARFEVGIVLNVFTHTRELEQFGLCFLEGDMDVRYRADSNQLRPIIMGGLKRRFTTLNESPAGDKVSGEITEAFHGLFAEGSVGRLPRRA